MQSLLSKDYASIRPLFAPPYSLIIDSVIAGTTVASVWVDDPAAPQTALVQDRNHTLYCGGRATNDNALRSLLEDVLLPATIASDTRYIKVCDSSVGWEDLLPTLFAPYALARYPRHFYTFPPERPHTPTAPLPPHATMSPIDAALLARTDLAHLDGLRGEIGIMWASEADFLAHGFGFCVLVDDVEIACWCTAEYVSGHQCGIGIETVEAHQRQGYARAATGAFLQHCRENGLTAHWDCWERNMASVAVAAWAGFGDPLRYRVAICDLATA